MAQLLVRNLDHHLKERLRERATRNHRSMEEEVRRILQDVLTERPGEDERGWASKLAGRFEGSGEDFEIAEIRWGSPRPIDVDK